MRVLLCGGLSREEVMSWHGMACRMSSGLLIIVLIHPHSADCVVLLFCLSLHHLLLLTLCRKVCDDVMLIRASLMVIDCSIAWEVEN